MDQQHLLFLHLLETELRLVNFVRDVGACTHLVPASLAFVLHVRIGEVVPTLTQVAFDLDASLIIVGSAAAGVVGRLLHTSVAERLVHEGRYSVLVAREPHLAGLVKTPPLDARRPGQPLTSPREGMLQSADRVDFAVPRPHISGLL